jgi:predicted enzyme related to lactoylglutathione lyase
MITKAFSVGIHVRDQQRALEFYRDKLGFKVLADAPMSEHDPSVRWLAVGPEGAATLFVLFTPPGQEDRIGTFSNVIFDCADIQQTHQELSDRGVEFEEPPSQQPWGWWAVFKDSEGNTFGLGQH